uniref:C2H2-type domain-containing protein n=1 Tax=Mastacembelus armatus TaxID=205130 RepID=A0A7N8YRF5_9TELE
MDGAISELPGASLPLSALRLLVPPIRLVSAAIWQTVEQKIVSDYGLLEEFVFMVTEIVPQLLSTRQRAELILGLRARLILELCRSEDTWLGSYTDFIFQIYFMDFFAFQDVFPNDFGPTYDKAIQTLMWLFLSRLEKLLPTQTLQQVHLIYHFRTKLTLKNRCDVLSSKPYWTLRKTLSYVVDTGILSALSLPPVERVVIVNDQTEADAESGLVYTVCTEMEVESENKDVYVEAAGNSEECTQSQWFGLSSGVKPEMDSVVVTDPMEVTEASESEMADDHRDDRSETLIIGEDGQVTVLDAKSKDLDDRTCKVCGKVVSHVKFLQRHMSQHSEELPYSCTVCKRFYKSLRYLQQHKCMNPAKRRSSKESGQKSPEGNKTIIEGPFYCPHCSVEFKCKQTFRFHLRNICYNEQQVDPEKPEDIKHCFRCDECDKAFKYKSTLDSHKQTHNPLYCEVCMKLVRDPEALAMHKESHTPFQCNQCEENFPVFKALHKHYIDVHNPTEPFTCTHCQTTFASLKRFIRHEWKHTGYQPFQCPHCSKRFRSYSDLVEHQKKHTKAYPFLCWECGKKFRHGVTLTRHVERVHHAGEPITEKPTPTFTCAQCGKTFTSRRCLLKHDNFHHKGLLASVVDQNLRNCRGFDLLLQNTSAVWLLTHRELKQDFFFFFLVE